MSAASPSDELLCCASPLATPSDALMALLPDEDTVRELLLQVRQKAYMEGAAVQQCSNQAAFEQGFRAGQHDAVERDSATTYGAGYDSGYQDGVRATRQAGP